MITIKFGAATCIKGVYSLHLLGKRYQETSKRSIGYIKADLERRLTALAREIVAIWRMCQDNALLLICSLSQGEQGRAIELINSFYKRLTLLQWRGRDASFYCRDIFSLLDFCAEMGRILLESPKTKNTGIETSIKAQTRLLRSLRADLLEISGSPVAEKTTRLRVAK